MPRHNAYVTAYTVHPEDPRLTVKIVCPECESEWGWSSDTSGNYRKLNEMAEQHNADAAHAIKDDPAPVDTRPIETLTIERLRDLYSWAYAWRTEDREGDTDLSGIRDRQRREFDQAIAEFEKGVIAREREGTQPGAREEAWLSAYIDGYAHGFRRALERSE